jgi:transcriptional regulator with XRE-family HTH domain
MGARDWIKAAEGQGWRVASVSGAVLRLHCDKPGCPGEMVLPLDNLGPVPDGCTLGHVGGHSRAAFASYQVLVEELRRRRRSLGLDQQDLTAAMGVPDGYVSKLESFARIASPPTLLLWAQALGLYVTTSPAPLPPATLRAIEQRQGKPYAENQARWRHAAG